jgi:hypothetical protein
MATVRSDGDVTRISEVNRLLSQLDAIKAGMDIRQDEPHYKARKAPPKPMAPETAKLSDAQLMLMMGGFERPAAIDGAFQPLNRRK